MPEHRNRVNILCYGQSIMAQPWRYKIYGDLKKSYPNADIVMENRAMGGVQSNELRLTAEADLYPTWPDLVLMHDYVANGKIGADSMEQIFANLRARTTSEIALDVWQQNANVDPATEDRYTLAQGLTNGKHTLEIIPNGDGPLSLRAFVVYHPPTVEMPPEPDSSIQPPPDSIQAPPDPTPAAQ